MPEPSPRSIRRRHKARMKARAHRVYPHWPEAFKAADYLAVCSRWCCGNRRKHDHLATMQERKLADLAKILEDVGINQAS